MIPRNTIEHVHNSLSTNTGFKRYCEYQAQQNPQYSTNKSQSLNQYCRIQDQATKEIQTTQPNISPFTISRICKTVVIRPVLSLKNIGEEVEARPKLGQTNVYSRENMHNMNKKIKMLKESMFGSINDKDKDRDRIPQKISADIKLSGSSPFCMTTSPFLPKRKIHSCAQLRSTQFFQQAPGSAQPKHRPKPYRSSKKIARTEERDKGMEENGRMLIKSGSFKATLKQKHIDDNPKVLANIIRKKVEFMQTDQIHDYIQSLMRRGKD